MQQKLILSLFVFSMLLFGIAGKCKKGSTPAPPGEPALQVTLSPPNGSLQSPAPQTDFPLVVTVTSTMPSQGVQIDVSAKKDDGSADPPFFTASQSTTTTPTNFTITGTPVNIVCIVNVTVTSKNTPTNKWMGSFRYSRKP